MATTIPNNQASPHNGSPQSKTAQSGFRQGEPVHPSQRLQDPTREAPPTGALAKWDSKDSNFTTGDFTTGDFTIGDFTIGDLRSLEQRTKELGRMLFDEVQQRRPGIFHRRWWEDQAMEWATRDEAVKTQMFRFVDVLPMLGSEESLNRHLQEYFGSVRDRLPWPAPNMISLAQPGSWTGRWIAEAARVNAGRQARRFIAGTNAQEVLATAAAHRKRRRAFTLDVLGEHVTNEAEAEGYLAAYCDLLKDLAPQVNSWPEIPLIDRGPQGPLPRVNISIKLSALDSQFDGIDPEGTYRRVAPRLRKLLRLAQEHRGFINFDMEEYDKKSLTLWVFQKILLEEEFRELADVGIVIQCYLKDSLEDLRGLHRWAQQRGTPVTVRLVKGAYWDYETIIARQRGWPIPVYQEKYQTDINFEHCTRYLLRAYPDLGVALGSHNLRSVAHGIATAEHLEMPPGSYEIQMLYGMADIEKDLFVEGNHRIRVYMPYGQLIPGMAYLVRRLLENTSNDSFLKASYQHQLSAEELLMNPLEHLAEGQTQDGQPATRSHLQDVGTTGPHAPEDLSLKDSHLRDFSNEPLLDFNQEEVRKQFAQALQEVHGQLGQHYPLIIDGQAVDTQQRITSLDPSHKTQVVGTTAWGTPEHVDQAVAAAKKALPAWSARPQKERSDLIRQVGEILEGRRYEFNAWITYECGKPWREADGDVTEAIDFCRYYALQAEQLASEKGVSVPGEVNRFGYKPRGILAVISPWNFPLSILTGMTVAGLATGNTAVCKPAEQSPVVAAQLMRIFQEVGFPPGVVNFLPGNGPTTGAALVEHPDVALIAFTGSGEVGLGIHAKAAEISRQRTRPIIKKVIAEMGGKNAIIVDEDADLDEAVEGVVHSAFGYAGQKCSACSRAIVLEPVYDEFVKRLADAARSLTIGPAEDPGTRLGPVIEQEAVDRIKRAIHVARNERIGDHGPQEIVSVPVTDLAGEGFYVGPHVFINVDPQSELAQEEIFGPVLAVLKAADLDHALQIANDVPYALTGAIYSRSPANLQRVAEELQAGNVYLNRGCTGAFVARQPFGGYKLSGIGSKAGGSDYLLQFVVPRVVTENTLRRGFAPADSPRREATSE